MDTIPLGITNYTGYSNCDCTFHEYELYSSECKVGYSAECALNILSWEHKSLAEPPVQRESRLNLMGPIGPDSLFTRVMFPFSE